MKQIGFPGFQHLYLVHDPLSNRPLRGQFDTDLDTCAITRGELVPTHPIPVRWAMGGATPSVAIWTTSAHPVIVHGRVVDLLQENNLTGWRTYPVWVTDKKGKLHRKYSGLAITGRCGPIDLSRSVVVLSQYPAGWFPHFLGHYFDDDSWDGSDLFMEHPDTRGHRTAAMFTTERVRQVFRRAKVRNLELERLTQVNVNTSIYEIGSTHLLPPDFNARVDAAYVRAGVPRPS